MNLQSTARLHPAADPCPPASMSRKGQTRPASGVYLSFTLCLPVNVFKRRFLSSCSQRSPHEVDMNELMAAMVLSSLSCSPLLHSPAQPDLAGTQHQTNKQTSNTFFLHEARLEVFLPLMVFVVFAVSAASMECGGGELSDSGYWSVGHAHRSPAPSPPIKESDASPATPPDEGVDMELDQVLFDEPAPRKRRVSGGLQQSRKNDLLIVEVSKTTKAAGGDDAFPPAELGEGGVQVSVAELR